jgi:hypothetical protein
MYGGGATVNDLYAEQNNPGSVQSSVARPVRRCTSLLAVSRVSIPSIPNIPIVSSIPVDIHPYPRIFRIMFAHGNLDLITDITATMNDRVERVARLQHVFVDLLLPTSGHLSYRHRST